MIGTVKVSMSRCSGRGTVVVLVVVMMMLSGENGACRQDRRRCRDGNGRHHRQWRRRWRRHRWRRRQPGRQWRRRREHDGGHGVVGSHSHVRSRLCSITGSRRGRSSRRHVMKTLQSLSLSMHNAIWDVGRRLWRLW